jgi:PAS domain S-box-containing protein
MVVIQMFMELQVLLTIFLVILFRFLQDRLPHREFFQWWTWAWVWFGVFLASGSLSITLGPEWTPLKGAAVLASTLAGFLQVPFVLQGVWSLRSRRPHGLRWKIALAALLGVATFAVSLASVSQAQFSYALRGVPRQMLLALAYFYSAGVLWLWRSSHRSRGARVLSFSCLAGGLLHLLNAGRTTAPLLGGTWQRAVMAVLDGVMPSDQRWFYLDIVWQCGIALGMVLLLLEDFSRAESALRQSERKFSKAFQASPDILVISEAATGRLLEVNDSFTRVTGYTRQEVLGRSALDLELWNDPADRERALAALHSEGRLRDMEIRYRMRGGELRVGLVSAELIQLAGRECALYVIRDITERQRVEEALRSIAQGTAAVAARDFFASLVKHLASALQVRYAFVTECTDHSRTRLRTLAFWKGDALAPNVEYPVAGGPCASVVLGETTRHPRDLCALFPEDAALRKLNAESYVGIPLLDSSGQVIGHLAVMHDQPMTSHPVNMQILQIFAARAGVELERERALRAVQASEERYRDLFENANDIIYTRDLQGRFTSLNKRGEEITGYNRQEILQMSVLDLIPPEEHARARELMLRPAAEGSAAYEFEIAARDGRRVWLDISTRRIVQDGEPVGVQGIARDVTDRKALEGQLRQAQKMEAIGLLAGGIAHDFNNLLMVISGYADLMLDRLPPKHVARRHAEQICKASQRAAGLTRQLLAFSRKQVLQPRVLDLNDVVLELGKMLPRVIREDIELTILPAANLGRVLADPGQIEQVIMNLVVNARDAMPHGGKLTIETGNVTFERDDPPHHPQMAAGDYVLLAVSDTGIGMDAATLRRIFEPFFTTKEQGKGTGLGLAMVYGIVKQSGGFIWAYSEPGEGATFKVYLPRVAAESIAEQAASPVLTGGTETILLVEDEEAVRALADEFLQAAGYTVLQAAGPAEALDLCVRHEGPIHLLLTDVVMPGMRGPELAERILALHPGTRVLFFSGYTDEAVVHHGILNRGVAFVEKPLLRSALVQRVRETLDRPQFATSQSVPE